MSRYRKNKTPSGLAGTLRDSIENLRMTLALDSIPYARKLAERTIGLSGWSSEVPNYFSAEVGRIIDEWKSESPETHSIAERVAAYNQDNYARSVLASRAVMRKDYNVAFARFFEVCEEAGVLYRELVMSRNEGLIKGNAVKGLERTANELLRIYEEVSPWLGNGWDERVYEFARETAKWIRENTGRKSVALRDMYYQLARRIGQEEKE